jgi:hypothetical protein
MVIVQESVDSKSTLKDLPNASPLASANLVLVFGSVKRFNEGKLQSTLKARYPVAQIVGCTTSGEISLLAFMTTASKLPRFNGKK